MFFFCGIKDKSGEDKHISEYGSYSIFFIKKKKVRGNYKIFITFFL